MIKKFSFWMVIVLVGSIGSMVFIHWNTIWELQQRTTHIQPLYQRQKTVDQLTLNLERYRRMSGSFRKLSPGEVADIKSRLKSAFVENVARLDQLDPTAEEKTQEHKLVEQVSELLRASAQIEPMLFSQDAYHKPEIQELHDEILSTLTRLGKSTQGKIESLRFDSTRSQTESVALLLGVGAIILIFVSCMLLRNHLVYVRPLRKLHTYALDLGQGKPVPNPPPHFNGIYGDIQNVMNQLAHAVEMHVRDRHKFIMDIVADLRGPLGMLQAGRYLLGDTGHQINEEQQVQAAESVKRGLAIFSGSLDNLNDIVDINRLENRLEEGTVDLCDLIADSAKSIVGTNFGKKISVSVPPIPVWVSVDIQRFGRVFVQVLSKVLGTLPEQSSVAVSVSQSMQGNYRGVEIQIQDAERFRNGRAAAGPEQDVLRHWISENGLSMTLVHKIIKAHGGTITAAGVAGTSVSITIRLPQERIVSRGLISPPTEDSSSGLRALVSNSNQKSGDLNVSGPPR